MKKHILVLTGLLILITSCNDQQSKSTSQTFENKAHQLVYDMVQKTGTYQDLLNKKDVKYTYTYTTPDSKKDVSTEQYIFDGELSLGIYQHHDRTFNQLEGEFTQGYNGKELWLKHKGQYLQDSTMLARVLFNRKTNFYWFTMLPKLLDPSVQYEYIKEQKIDSNTYDVVKISFKSTSNQPTDIYQLYINQETKLVDQFLFTVVDFNVIETPMLLQMDYKNVDGILIPNQRRYKQSTWNADITDKPWIHVTWTDIQFNNNLSRSSFDKK